MHVWQYSGNKYSSMKNEKKPRYCVGYRTPKMVLLRHFTNQKHLRIRTTKKYVQSLSLLISQVLLISSSHSSQIRLIFNRNASKIFSSISFTKTSKLTFQVCTQNVANLEVFSVGHFFDLSSRIPEECNANNVFVCIISSNRYITSNLVAATCHLSVKT